MPYKKNVITYFIISVLLIGLAVVSQIFMAENVAVFVVAILVGAATGIIATLVSCALENNHKLNLEIYSLEKAVSKILGGIYSIANLDVYDSEVIRKTKKHVDEINESFFETDDIIERINYLMISPIRERKIQKIIDAFNYLRTFIVWEYNTPKKIEKFEKNNAEQIQTFETLKVIKYMKTFEPQLILNYLQNSKNNKMKSLTDRDSFFHLIFSTNDLEKEREKEQEDYEKQEVEELSSLYEKYDIEKVKEHVANMKIKKWEFSSLFGSRIRKPVNLKKRK